MHAVVSTRSPRSFSDARSRAPVRRAAPAAPAPANRPPMRARVRVGAEPDVWVVVSTTASRADQDEKQAIPVGSTVRFTVQYGWRAGSEDDSNMAVLRGEVVAGRTPLLPDSYTVRVTEVALTNKLDPSVPLPPIGSVFLVAPWSVADVETVPKGAAPGGGGTYESYGVDAPPPAGGGKRAPGLGETSAPAGQHASGAEPDPRKDGGGSGSAVVFLAAAAFAVGVLLLV